jgi:hypothetical protein
LVAPYDVGSRLLAADDAAGVVVCTDLGGPTLEEILLGEDVSAARAAVISTAETLGRLHAATAHDVAQADPADALGMWPGVDRWDIVEASTTELGFCAATAARADVEHLRSRLLSPSPFLGLTHADVTPNNAVLTEGGARFVDFEGAAYGHMGLDACAFTFPFPCYSAHYAVLPPDVANAAEDAYRVALATGVPAALDDAAFFSLIAEGCGAMLAVRLQRLNKLADDDQTPSESWRRRTQLVQQIDVFVAVARRANALLAYADWAEELGAQMRARWSDAGSPGSPLFPAFRSHEGE